eukprot:1147838-Pelagomonas_calceolata.AAC.1
MLAKKSPFLNVTSCAFSNDQLKKYRILWRLWDFSLTLAEQLGICDDIAHEKATYWRALALPLPTYFEVAKCAVMPHVMVKQSTKPREEPLHDSGKMFRPDHFGEVQLLDDKLKWQGLVVGSVLTSRV